MGCHLNFSFGLILSNRGPLAMVATSWTVGVNARHRSAAENQTDPLSKKWQA
jgi:hypothetical protein